MSDNIVRMYKWIDTNDGVMSMFAIKGNCVAPSWFNNKWLKQETFGSFSNWNSTPDESDAAIIAATPTFEFIWEAEDLE